MADVSESTTETPRSPRLARLWATRHQIEASHIRLLSIVVGGAAGAIARAGVGRALPHTSGSWPWATFAVNLTGALLLAWLTIRLSEMVAPTRYWRFLLGTGFCGALTTFSALQVETIQLVRDGRPGMAIGYAGASLTGGMAIAVAGTILARRRRYG